MIVALAAAACGGASEDEAPSSRTSSAAACGLAPGEDVCARPLEGVAPEEVERVRTALDAATAFAGVVGRARAEIDAACEAGLVDLGSAPPETGACAALVQAMGQEGRGLEVEAPPPACATVAPPSCVAGAPSRRTCTPPKVVAAAPAGASPRAAFVAAMVSRRFGPVFAMKETLATAADLAGTFSGTVSAIADLPAACIPEATAMIATATTDARTATEDAAALIAALGY